MYKYCYSNKGAIYAKGLYIYKSDNFFKGGKTMYTYILNITKRSAGNLD